ncbi:MAG: hypothetical protein KatS3mg009_1035 [Acidimicrobiia bacterium]|nr:MAG: hypothetical protein KatS3mg009_1035 [Acidimicrobiia bacterium]
MTASRSARSFAKCRYTVRSFTPARAATARIVMPRQSRIDDDSRSSSAPAATIRSRVWAARSRRRVLS